MTLKDNLEDKEESIRSYAKRNVDLKRKLQEAGKTNVSVCVGGGRGGD